MDEAQAIAAQFGTMAGAVGPVGLDPMTSMNMQGMPPSMMGVDPMMMMNMMQQQGPPPGRGLEVVEPGSFMRVVP